MIEKFCNRLNNTYINRTEWHYWYNPMGEREQKLLYYAPGQNFDGDSQTLGIYNTKGICTPAPIDWYISWLIYGSAGHGRFATIKEEFWNTETDLLFEYSDPGATFTRQLYNKEYELKDHLGNVRLVFSDLKLRTADTTFDLDIRAVNNYYPFGMLQPGRYWQSGNYRYGFNSMEKDDEIKGVGNSLDFGSRIYDSRLGRWLSRDPSQNKYSSTSPYAGFFNNPISFIDPDGKDGRLSAAYNPETGKETVSLESTIHTYGPDANKSNADFINERFAQLGITNQGGEIVHNYIEGKGHTLNVVDESGIEWEISINIQFVHDPRIIDNNKYETAVEVIKNAVKGTFIPSGDNIQMVDESIKGDSPGHTGLSKTGSWSSVTMDKSFPTSLHEGFHNMGFGDRYDEIGAGLTLRHEGFEGDVMSSDQPSNINYQHFIDVLNLAKERMQFQGPTENKIEIKNEVIRNTKIDQSKSINENNNEKK